MLWLCLMFTLLISQGCQNESEILADTNPALESYLKSGFDKTTIAEVNFDGETVIAHPSLGVLHSTTNVQETGVDESDLVKFDGQFLYVADDPAPIFHLTSDASLSTIDIAVPEESPKEPASIYIFQPNNTPDTPPVGKITLDSKVAKIIGLYVYSSKSTSRGLAVIVHQRSEEGARTEPFHNSTNQASIYLYGINDQGQAAEKGRLRFDGKVIGSRRIDNRLYFVSTYLPELNVYAVQQAGMNIEDYINTIPLKALLPKQYTGNISTGLFDARRCTIPNPDSAGKAPSLVSVVSLDLNAPALLQATCLADDVHDIYSSAKSLYLVTRPRYDWEDRSVDTGIYKYTLANKLVEYRGLGEVPGKLIYPYSFSLGERNGVLHTVSVLARSQDELREAPGSQLKHLLTAFSESDSVADKLEIVGQIPNDSRPEKIGKPGENIYSVRFIQDYAYVVTYRQIDPLYIINLKNPQDPYIEGEVELPGFSEYLHPIGEHYVLGIGYSGADRRLKLVLFNVANPDAPFVVQELVMPESRVSSPLFQDHKSMSIVKDGEDAYRFAFPVQYSYQQGQDLLLYSLDLSVDKPIKYDGQIVYQYQQNCFPYQLAENKVQRSIIQEQNIHYIHDGKIISAFWDFPEFNNGMCSP
ncbi:MAG TPA: hypothetical protein DCZ03_13085 [Gammaproteobacteria bacterium]|nr:hypothetical protein [Gammaproteobacteria bacterium]